MNIPSNTLYSIIILIGFSSITSWWFSSQKNSYPIDQSYIPTGFMGDAESCETCVEMTPRWEVNPASAPECYRIMYIPGKKKWAGVYWQYPADNWCEKSGLNLSNRSFSRITFSVKGEFGGERVRFKSGHDCPEESCNTDEKTLTLSTQWQKDTIPLCGEKLENLSGAFAWVATARENTTDTIIFYLDDIQFE